MSVFDMYIQETYEYVEKLKNNIHNHSIYVCEQSSAELLNNLPVKVGNNANPRIILRQDMSVELGNPLQGSCGMVLWTDHPSLINHGKITVYGPDISGSSNNSLPFAQIILIGGKTFTEKDHEAILDHQYIADQIEGYMVKSSPGNIWSRVSRQAQEKGFNFMVLGNALISIIKNYEPRADAVEIFFITSSKEDVKGLCKISDKVKIIGKEVMKINWKNKGYDLDCTFDCNSCHDQPVCDVVREVLAVQKKGR